MNSKANSPVVMCLSGADPTGGAGIQADIEAIASHGCHAAPVITALTVQNTHNVIAFEPVASDLVIQQARAVLEDMPVAAFKVGMLARTEIAEAVHTIFRDYPDIPVILDPVLAAGGGTELASDELIDAIKNLLLPYTYILTPNTVEACRLASDADSPEAAAMSLLELGCHYVLLTGGHAQTREVSNMLFGNHRALEQFIYPRLDGDFHGSGCTLAASIASLIAQGQEPFSAVRQAQDYTFKTLQHARHIGMGQQLPDRFFWIRSSSGNQAS